MDAGPTAEAASADGQAIDRVQDLAAIGGSVDASSLTEAGSAEVQPIDRASDVPVDLGFAAPDMGSDALSTMVDDAGLTQKDALLERMCWGDGLATVQTLADPSTSAGCADQSLQPCQFPVTLPMSSGKYCMPGPGGYCIADFVYLPPFQAGGAPSCLQCKSAGFQGTALRFVVRVPPSSDFPQLPCPSHSPSGEARFLVWSFDDKALYRIAGTDQMTTIVGVEEVDRSLWNLWTASH